MKRITKKKVDLVVLAMSFLITCDKCMQMTITDIFISTITRIYNKIKGHIYVLFFFKKKKKKLETTFILLMNKQI
jgi:hypothetical protein